MTVTRKMQSRIVSYSVSKTIFLSIRKNYSSKHKTKEERRENLKQALHFDCECIACVNNFPLRTNYSKDKVPLFEDDADIRQRIVNCSDYLEKFDDKYPCVEVDFAQEVLISSMTDLYGNVSAKCNFKTMCKY